MKFYIDCHLQLQNIILTLSLVYGANKEK